ncbi:filamin/ABP280 repeat domain-containing protein [Cohnella herbarum]|uniref:YtkA-like domain-containing protein n=1 Tax=Cohnella herbarum TaxID=2728023 RepID=A0A7Z2VH13_9BACL|nr:filamin/ABP280 repeat domain-containing protein [Cohnella herbarum]QJD82825.1 hypothetical protein HH215_06285 [Cohnella herbarum]
MGNLFGRLLLAISVILVVLTGCGSSASTGDQDPKNVKVELSTIPEQARSGEETNLQVTITGLVDEKNTDVQFEIRHSDNSGLPDLIQEVESKGKGKYTAPYVFKNAAKYDVYIHLYNQDIHITKKKPLVVME